jgi:hypothetical protein
MTAKIKSAKKLLYTSIKDNKDPQIIKKVKKVVPSLLLEKLCLLL